MPKAAAIYARISRDRLHDEKGIKRQLEDCRALAEQKGWIVAEEYTDDDRSAYSGKPRKRYLEMLADIKAGIRDAVIVYDHYRLVRQMMELEDFFLIYDAAGLRHMATCAGDLDLGTEDGRFKARILGAVAQKESADKSRRIRRKHLELAETGKPSGGLRSFGYTLGLTALVPDEAEIIHELAERFLAGESLRSLAADLNRRGIVTARGRKWSPNAVRKVLRSARISGQREHHGQIVSQAKWPAIITPEQTARIRAILDDPSRHSVRTPRTYMLSGLVRCERCGARMISRKNAAGKRRYACSIKPGSDACGGVAVLADPVEELVTEGVFVLVDSPRVARALTTQAEQDDQEEATHAELSHAEARMEELAAAYGSGAIGMREWIVARDPIEARITSLRRRVTQANGTSAIARYVGASDRLRQEWDDLPIERRQAIVKALVHQIVISPVKPGSKFTPKRVQAAWRF